LSERIATTEELRQIVEAAEGRLFRWPNPTVMENVDPDGWHVLDMILFGHEVEDTSRPHHHRASAFLKMAGSNRPFVVYLDVVNEWWERLPTYKEWRRKIELAQAEELAAKDLAAALTKQEEGKATDDDERAAEAPDR